MIYAKIIAAALLALVVGLGTAKVVSTFAERDALLVTKNALTAERDKALDERDSTISEANKKVGELRDELTKRDRIATAATARADQTTKELQNAQATIAKWRKTADANLSACLDLPLPFGLFDIPKASP